MPPRPYARTNEGRVVHGKSCGTGSLMNATASLFKNRRQAGQLLARELKDFARQANVTVLALGVNGIPVAGEVAKELHCPLDVILCRRLDFGDGSAGAVSCEGVRVLNYEEIGRA